MISSIIQFSCLLSTFTVNPLTIPWVFGYLKPGSPIGIKITTGYHFHHPRCKDLLQYLAFEST